MRLDHIHAGRNRLNFSDCDLSSVLLLVLLGSGRGDGSHIFGVMLRDRMQPHLWKIMGCPDGWTIEEFVLWIK